MNDPESLDIRIALDEIIKGLRLNAPLLNKLVVDFSKEMTLSGEHSVF